MMTSGLVSSAVVNSAILALICSGVYRVQMALIRAGDMFIFYIFILKDWGYSLAGILQRVAND